MEGGHNSKEVMRHFRNADIYASTWMVLVEGGALVHSDEVDAI